MIKKPHITSLLLVLIPFSLCWSLRLSTFITIGYVSSVFLFNPISESLRKAASQKWLYAFLALYLMHVLSLLWTTDLSSGLFILEKKASLFVLPLAIAMDLRMNREVLRLSMMSLVIGTFLALWTCIIFAIWRYLHTFDYHVFFYHELGSPLNHFNAIYFSCFVFFSLISLFFLRENGQLPFSNRKTAYGLLLTTLLGGLILLASRFFIVLTMLFFVWVMVRTIQLGRFYPRLRIAAIAALLFLGLGVFSSGFPQQRFQELLASDFQVLQQETFNWDTPFNGLTLRLLFLKFGWEMLTKNKAFLTGLGLGDAQNELDQTIIEHNLYHGNATLGDKGYLGYNTHNEFMEMWLQVGLGGVFLLILILVQSWLFNWQQGQQTLLFMTIAIAGFACIEGIFERQRGIVLITFFLSCIYTGIKK